MPDARILYGDHPLAFGDLRLPKDERTGKIPVAVILWVSAVQLGASSLKDLSLALFVGTAAGLYSSVFIATPLVVHRIIPGRLGLEHWTLRCTKCGHIHQDAIDTSSPPHKRPASPTLWPDT